MNTRLRLAASFTVVFSAIPISADPVQGAVPAPPASSSPAIIRDCEDCPDLLLIPKGTFMMGTLPGGYEQTEATGEGEPVKIVVPAPFLIGRNEITVRQFATFVKATKYRPAISCRVFQDGRWTIASKASWARSPSGEALRDDWPVTCVSWQDTRTYVAWLSARSGQHYRLPSESEWEYASRGGVDAPRYWGWNSFEGVSISDACDNANVFDVTSLRDHPFAWPHAQCADGFSTLAPVGSFKPNAYGLYDAIGNVWEWAEDCYTASYANRARDSRAWVWSGGCEERVMRGGGWASRPLQARATNRGHRENTYAANDLGFRVARDAEGDQHGSDTQVSSDVRN